MQQFGRGVSEIALETGDSVGALLAATHPAGATVKDVLTGHIATIGENMNVRRAAVLAVDPGDVVSYVHNAAGEGLGKIGVLVAVQSSAPAGQLPALATQLALTVAAANQRALDAGGLTPAAEEH